MSSKNREALQSLLNRQYKGEQLSPEELKYIDFLVGFLGESVLREILDTFSNSETKNESSFLSLIERSNNVEFSNVLIGKTAEIMSNRYAKEFIKLIPDLAFFISTIHLSKDPSMNIAMKDALINVLTILDTEGVQVSLGILFLTNEKARKMTIKLIVDAQELFRDNNGNYILDGIDELINKLTKILKLDGNFQT